MVHELTSCAQTATVSYDLGKAFQSLISLHCYNHAMQTEKLCIFYHLFFNETNVLKHSFTKYFRKMISLEEMEAYGGKKGKPFYQCI